jgi:hypothetical protein
LLRFDETYRITYLLTKTPKLSTIKILYPMIKKTLLLLLPLLLLSCEGPTGPQGPAGQNGNANVKAYVFNNLNWSEIGGEAFVSGQLSAINAGVLSTGAVLTYASIFDNNGSEVQWQLPWTVVEGTYQENVFMMYSTGTWYLTNTASDDLPTLYEDIPKIKIVVIQGTSGKKEMVNPNISWEELVARYPNMETIEMN